MACGSKEFDPPFPFPPRGKLGREGIPPRRKHAARQQKALARIDAAGSPHKRAAAPLCIPRLHPAYYRTGAASENTRAFGSSERMEIAREIRTKDGRHVGLDFYDLLIEPIMANNGTDHPSDHFSGLATTRPLRRPAVDFADAVSRHWDKGPCTG